MSIHRIYAIILRNLYIWPRGIERFMWSIGWPLLSIITWGLTATYLQQNSSFHFSIVALILGGIIFWTFTSRSQLEVTICFMEEYWNKNLINIFSTPLSMSEFLVAAVILDILKLIISTIFLTIFAQLLYSFNILMFGWYFPAFFISLVLFGWIFGYFVIALIIRFGVNAHELAWSLIAFLSPFMCIYYPLSALPIWAKTIGLLLPPTYIFEEMRRFMIYHTVIWQNLLVSFLLNIFYLVAVLLFLYFMFEKARETGRLTKLEG